MTQAKVPGPADPQVPWAQDPGHRAWLRAGAQGLLGFFRAGLRADGGFDVPGHDGSPLPDAPQELHTTTRLVHSYALGRAFGAADCDAMIDAGLDFLWHRHRDARQGGYLWSVGRGGAAGDDSKLAYGHVFVLLAASSALEAGHPDAGRLFADIAEVIERRFWDEGHGLLREEFARDWSPLSDYRGMNANMHGVEALLAAYEATGETLFRDRAGRILDFFLGQVGPRHGWRLPEHYRADWTVDPAYAGNPMFRPAGTTPGHSFEMARLQLQHWDLCGRREAGAPARAGALVARALADAWAPGGGIVYTLDAAGAVAIPDRYWWPVAEAIGAVAAQQKLGWTADAEGWYRRLWTFAAERFIDPRHGGWFPEIDAEGRPAARQFRGKPDLYHAFQATLLPLVPSPSRLMAGLAADARS